MTPDVLMLDRIGGAYTHASLAKNGLGGSEIELLQVAHGFTAKGHSVVVANGVDHVSVEDGVTYVPVAQAGQYIPKKTLYLQRFSAPETPIRIPTDVRVVVRANDVYCAPYNVHRRALESGRAALIANTHWQADQFAFAKERWVIHPMLEPMPKVRKQKGLFVFASGAMKGFEETVGMWCDLKHRHPQMKGARLAIVCPGWGDPRALTGLEKLYGVEYVGNPTPEEYRRWIAKAEGTFTVLRMPETFGCFAALAERAGTRNHILCLAGTGGLSEAVHDVNAVTEDPKIFEAVFLESLGHGLKHSFRSKPDTHILDQWEDYAINWGRTPPVKTSRGILAPTFGPGPLKTEIVLPELTFAADPTLAANQAPLGPFFGDFLSELRSALAPGGSELGVGLMLFSLAASIQAREIVEIGRFKGFSTLALAAACKLQDIGWAEPKMAEQRPDVDYVTPKARPRVVSIDPSPLQDAEKLFERAGVQGFIQRHNGRSDTFTPQEPIDLLFIDGGHTVSDVRSDVNQFVPWVRPGGYFILHDYYGWFRDGVNGSPIAQVIAEDLTTCDRVLIDTGYASLVVFRKAKNLTERWELSPRPSRIPARADGRPTVGLVIIAMGDEASTVATRAIATGRKTGVDCVTLVCDTQDATADVARSLGVDVFIRPTPPHDWEKGIGWIAGARNEAVALAEHRTDYVLALDADDWLEGTLPAVLDQDTYEVTIRDGALQYQRQLLFRSSLGCRYHGIIHEVLQAPAGVTCALLPDLTYRRGHSTYGFQDRDPPAVKFSKHAHLSRKWLLDHPDDARAQFYLARSLQDAGRLDEALDAYERRIAMLNGWEEERSYAAYQKGRILISQQKDPTAELIRAHGIGLPKAEPFTLLAQWYRDESRRQFSAAYTFATAAAAIPLPVAGLFLQPSVYQYEAAAEVAIAAYWLGRKQEALERFEALLPRVPPDQRQWAEGQIAICLRELAQGAR